MENVEKAKSAVDQSSDPFAKLRDQLKRASSAHVTAAKELVLVIDESGSMGHTVKDGSVSKLQAVIDVGKKMVTRYNSRVKFKIVGFSDNAKEYNTVDQLFTKGSTYMSQGLDMVTTPGCHAVVMSDGDTYDKPLEQIPRLIANKIVVHTIGCGDDCNEELLRELAAATGGTFMLIDESFDAIFGSIEALVSKAVAALNPAKTIELGN